MLSCVQKSGRAVVRTTLGMAMLTVVGFNRLILTFCKRLLANGKHKKVPLAACTDKLLIVLNAMVRDNKGLSEGLTC